MICKLDLLVYMCIHVYMYIHKNINIFYNIFFQKNLKNLFQFAYIRNNTGNNIDTKLWKYKAAIPKQFPTWDPENEFYPKNLMYFIFLFDSNGHPKPVL